MRVARDIGAGFGSRTPLTSAPIGDNQDDYDELENGVLVGRIFTVPTAPPWSALDVGERPRWAHRACRARL
jgi:hypothetical protein